MITYQHLLKHPAALRSLTGYTRDDFGTLFRAFQAAHETRRAQTNTPRRRAPGAGRPTVCSLETQLVMALVWLRVYPTFAVLAFLFGLHESNAWRNVQDTLQTLQSLADFAFEKPARERKTLRSVEAVMDAFPDVVLVIDAKEQRTRRPKSDKDNDEHAQSRLSDFRKKPFYSGKKKTHTQENRWSRFLCLKNQVAVQPGGKIGAVSASVPGGANHDLRLLRESHLLDNLSEGEAAMMDKGYDGITKDYPGYALYLPHKARRNRPLTPAQKAYNRLLSSYRIVVGHTNAQLNQYKALSQVWRNRRESHTGVFRVICSLVNGRIENCPLKRYPAQLSLLGAIAH